MEADKRHGVSGAQGHFFTPGTYCGQIFQVDFRAPFFVRPAIRFRARIEAQICDSAKNFWLDLADLAGGA
jgi:hypothetical protein